MDKVLITYKLHDCSIQDLPEEIVYKPFIGFFAHDEIPCDYHDFRKKIEYKKNLLLDSIKNESPKIIVIGNNPLDYEVLHYWRHHVDDDLHIIRRGTEIGGINHSAAADFNIKIHNTPSINSPYVARFIQNELQMIDLQDKKIGIMGFGAIGKQVYSDLNNGKNNVRVYIYSRERSKTCEDEINKDFFDDLGILIISIPWLNSNKIYNKNYITLHDVMKLKTDCLIFSVSNPFIFTPDALEHLEKSKMKVNIHTGTQYALEIQSKYSNIQCCHDKAFSDEYCQIKLDGKVFEKINEIQSR